MTGRHADEIRDNPEFRPDWDVMRDADGWPVTISWDQVRAIWHAIFVVESVRRAEGHESLWYCREPSGGRDAKGNEMNTQTSAELGKSRLLGRMLVDGLPPTMTRPPVEMGGPEWWGLPGGDPFRGPYRKCRHCGGDILPVPGGGWVHAGGAEKCAVTPVAEPFLSVAAGIDGTAYRAHDDGKPSLLVGLGPSGPALTATQETARARAARRRESGRRRGAFLGPRHVNPFTGDDLHPAAVG